MNKPETISGKSRYVPVTNSPLPGYYGVSMRPVEHAQPVISLSEVKIAGDEEVDIRVNIFQAALQQASEEREMTNEEILSFAVNYLRPHIQADEIHILDHIASLDTEQLDEIALAEVDKTIERLVKTRGPLKIESEPTPQVYEDPSFTQDTLYNPLYPNMAIKLLRSDSLKPLPVIELEEIKAANGTRDGHELAALEHIMWREMDRKFGINQPRGITIRTNIMLFLRQCSEELMQEEAVYIGRLIVAGIRHDKGQGSYLDYNALLKTPPQGGEAQRLSGDKEFCESLKAAMQNDLEPKKRMASFNKTVRKGQKKWNKVRKSTLSIFKKANGTINSYFKKPKTPTTMADTGNVLVLANTMRMPWYMKAQDKILAASVQMQVFLASTIQMMPSLDSLKPSNNRKRNAFILAGAFVVFAIGIGITLYLNQKGFHVPSTGNMDSDLAKSTSDAFRAAVRGTGKAADIVANNTPAPVPSASAVDAVQAATSSVTDIAEPVARNTAKAAHHVIRAKATAVEHLSNPDSVYWPDQDAKVMNKFLAAATDADKALAELNKCPTEECRLEKLSAFMGDGSSAPTPG